MATSEDLIGFVREALGRGLPRERIEAALRDAGWPAEQVRAALGAFAAVDFPLAVPRPRTSLSPRDAFTYLVLFTTLYVVAFHLGRVLFIFVDRAFPDPTVAAPPEFTRAALRFSAAALVVAGPVFLYVSSVAARDTRRSRAMSPVRRWLTYLTLFVAACVLLGDVTTLIYNVLGGELTTRFVLKVLVVGGIAGAVFGYYFGDLREDEREGAMP